MSKRNRYTREFKLEAVRQLISGQKPVATLALELGVKRNQLYQWRDQYEEKGDQAFPGVGRRSSLAESDLAQLRKENEKLKEENEILKKAAAFFAKEMK